MVSPRPVPVVFFAAVPYDHCLSGRTRRLAETLSALGHSVTFVELPSLRTMVTRLVSRNGSSPAGPPVRVVTLKPLPGYLRLRTTAVGGRWLRYAVGRLTRELPDLEKALVIVSTPWWVPIVRELPRRILCYDYIDHISVHTPGDHVGLFTRWDEELLEASDMVSAVSEVLKREIAARVDSGRVVLIPNGVRESWLDARGDGFPRGQLTAGRHTPVAGFVGALFEWVDLALIEEAAARLPDVAFVLVGPRRRGISLARFKANAQVRCFPAVPYEAVPRWIRSFDVCLIPFRDAFISHSADPVKLYEYLALGKPVVSTFPFGEEGTPRDVAADPVGFAACIREALGETGESRRAERIAFARRHTWELRAARLVQAAEETLAVSRPEPHA